MAERFSGLADGMRARRVPAEKAAHFLMKLMFCMFAEDTELLPDKLFSKLLTGKGRTSKMKLTLPPETRKALEAWICVRGEAPGPLFWSMNRARPDKGRLTAIGLYGMVRELGRKMGLKVWPHGLRHAAITEALDLTGGNVRAVQRFSRHRDIRILERYDDNRRDLGGEVAKQVAASVPGENLSL
ncbi:MAG TPA: tyrosine-type recombinase/integrase [Gemmataceae bacterium]|nr:tyrosine-type recombinase/integrase [Gemmataceae bacterium]